jgi:hypothetical protein
MEFSASLLSLALNHLEVLRLRVSKLMDVDLTRGGIVGEEGRSGGSGEDYISD